MIGTHIQNSPNRWPAAIAALPPNAMNKLLFGVERAAESKAANPNVKTWYRWVGAQPLPSGDVERHCRDWLNQFVDGTFRREVHNVDYTQCYNETLANSQSAEEKALWINLHTTMARLWHEEYRWTLDGNPRLILCETAIGNDIPWQIAEAAVRYDAVLGYHPYIVCRVGRMDLSPRAVMPVRHDGQRSWFHDWSMYYRTSTPIDKPQELYKMHESPDIDMHASIFNESFAAVAQPDFVSPHDWRWYSGRWAAMDAEFVARGLHVDWAFGEGGPVLDASTNWSGWLDPLGGWKSPNCLNGDINKYKQVLDYWLQNTFQTPAYQEGRILGCQLFTSGAPGGSGGTWALFDLVGDDLQEIAEYVGAYDYPPIGEPPPPPPPPPEPNPCRGAPRVQYGRTYLTVPQNATRQQWQAVCDVAYEQKQTVGFSADDACIGDLDKRHAVFYGLDASQRGEYADWVAEHYPGVVASFLDYPQPKPEPSQGIVIDVSNWQGRMDWAKAKAAGVTHAYIKATQGTSHVDAEFLRNWAGAKAHGIIHGAYHYYENNKPPGDQAQNFLNVLKLTGDYGKLPPALDVEDTTAEPSEIDLMAWLAIVEGETKRTPGIYTGAWYWDSYFFPAEVDWARQHPLWVASYRDNYPIIPEDWNEWWLWQYTPQGDGATYGAQSKYIDMNRFNTG